MSKSSKVKVIQKENAEPIATEVIAQSIVEISASMKRINEGRLNHRALVLLVSQSANVNKTEVEKVLSALSGLEATYLKKKERA